MPSKFSKGGALDYSHPKGQLPKFWSFTRYSAWSACHLRYALAFIWKLKGPPNRAMDRGNAIHKKSEHYIDGTLKGIPSALMTFRDEYAAVRKLGAVAEESYTVTKTWQPTSATDWDHAWLRAKVDIEILEPDLLSIIDIKTGRAYPNHDEQAEIYGVLGFIIHPEVDQIDFEYWYVDSGESAPHTFRRDGLRERKQAWMKKVTPMLSMRTFKATPSESACRFCDFRSDKELSNGEAGPCNRWK